MKSLIAVIAVTGSLAAMSTVADAFPALNGTVAASGVVATQVGWRCGPHRHWAWRFHRCVFNRY